jgi:hypothetical protein
MPSQAATGITPTGQKGDERTGPHDLTPGIVAQADIHHPSRARDADQRVTGDDPYDVDRDGDGGDATRSHQDGDQWLRIE